MNRQIYFSGGEKGSAMRKSRIKKLAIACIAACAVLGGIGATNAQMHDGSHAGGGGFHGGGGSHGGGFHGGGGMHHGGGFHGRVFIGPPIIFGQGYYPYGYSYPYGDTPYDYSYPYGDDSSSYQWYCRDPAGYYPDVQNCPSGWLQVAPNG
jgi:hypothetical protein